MEQVLLVAAGAAFSLVAALVQRQFTRRDQAVIDQRASEAEHAQWIRRERMRTYAAFARATKQYMTVVSDADGKAVGEAWELEWRPQLKTAFSDVQSAIAELQLVGHGDVVGVAMTCEIAALECLSDFIDGHHPSADPTAHQHMRQLARAQGNFIGIASRHLTNVAGTDPLAIGLQKAPAAGEDEAD